MFIGSLLLAIVPQAASELPPSEVSKERIEAAFEDARKVVGKTLGAVPEGLALRIVEPDVIALRVAEENLPSISLGEGDPEVARARAQALGEAYAQFAFAKYAWSTGELLVAPASWETHARELERPGLISDGTLRAVLVHELVHALDDAAYDFSACVARLADTDAIAGFNAVVEGHAQVQARRLCEQAGWKEGFEIFTSSIGAVPPSAKELGEAMLLLLRLQSATTATAYHQGERFIAAIQAEGGADAVARAFREPPRDGDTIFHPEWFLDPALRPSIRYDLERGLDVFAERFDPETWLSQRLSIQPGQLEASMALLPAESIQRIKSTLRGNRMLVAQPKQDPSSKLVALAVMEFDADESARFYIEAVRELGLLKDEAMKTGQVQILEAVYADPELPFAHGVAQRKRMKAGPSEILVTSISAARGRAVIETIFSNETIEDSSHRELVVALLDAVREIEKAGEDR